MYAFKLNKGIIKQKRNRSNSEQEKKNARQTQY